MFALYQSQMANLLGIDRSRLAKAETGDRSLDTASLLKLAEYEKSLRECRPDHPNPDIALSYCKKRLRNNDMALTNLERKLEQMQRCHVVGRNLPIAFVGSEHERRVESRHKNCGNEARQVVQIKRDLLLGENKMLEKIIAGLTPVLGSCDTNQSTV